MLQTLQKGDEKLDKKETPAGIPVGVFAC